MAMARNGPGNGPGNGPRDDDAPLRPAQTQTGRWDRTVRTVRWDTGQRYDQRRVRCALSARRTVVHIVTAAPAPRQAASPSGEALSHVTHRVDMPLALVDGVAQLAAGAFAEARRPALRLHDERHEDARLALRVASDLGEIAHRAHCAVEAVEAVELVGSVDTGGEMGT